MRTASCYWITGLPAAGKTTLAKALQQALQGQNIATSLLDGDELRKGLCSDLGLTAEDRSENIRRAGEVARLMAHAGLTVVCAFVSPYESDRQRVRRLFTAGSFIEIHLSTSLQECIQRDPKKLYARAQSGEITGLTGWDAPYETPTAAEFTFDTSIVSVDNIVETLLRSSARNAHSKFA